MLSEEEKKIKMREYMREYKKNNKDKMREYKKKYLEKKRIEKENLLKLVEILQNVEVDFYETEEGIFSCKETHPEYF